MAESPESRRGHPIADAIGAVMRGAREGDKVTRKRTASWLAMLGGGGLAVYIAVRAWGLAEEGIRRTWQTSDQRTERLVTSVDRLIEEIRVDRRERTRDLDLIMDRLKIPRRPSPAPSLPPIEPSPKPPFHHDYSEQPRWP